MLVKGWIKGAWRKSEKNRRARYYSLTAAGREQIGLEVDEFQRVTEAIQRVIEPA
jgi:DNA-binding PadR family transcriptional regulator